jgi:hypothetical protein
VRTVWAEIGRGTLALIAFRQFRRAELGLDFVEQRHERYRIEIDNADNPPLEITGVEAEGPRWRVVLLDSGNRTYRVAYGSDTAETPHYDTTMVLDAIHHRGYQPVAVTLGPQTANPAYREGRTLPGFLNGAAFLTLAIIAMVLVLAWILFRAGQQLNKLPQEDV